MKAIQDLKVEIETIKKTEVKLEMKNLASQAETSEVSSTNRI